MALAERLAQLAADPTLGARMGEAGLARAHREFTWAHVAAQLEAVYRRVARIPADLPVTDLRRERAKKQQRGARAAAGRV